MNAIKKQVREMQIKYDLSQEECNYWYKRLEKEFEEDVA